jgi:uncharacterized Zn ribbon protein|nr:MAG TPA: phnA-like protein [Caudoviricetes sp.]
MLIKVTCNKCGSEITMEDWDDIICEECGNNIWVDNGTVYQECEDEFHSDIIGDAIGVSMAEAYEYFGDPDDEDWME